MAKQKLATLAGHSKKGEERGEKREGNKTKRMGLLSGFM